MRNAMRSGMSVYRFQDLVCWQLSYELKCEVFAFTESDGAFRDFKFRDQIRDSSSGAPRTIAEGFGRFTPGEFAQFLRYARGSLVETQNHLIDGRDRGYLDLAKYSRLASLSRSALRATTNLMRSKQQQAAAAQRRPSRQPRNAPQR